MQLSKILYASVALCAGVSAAHAKPKAAPPSVKAPAKPAAPPPITGYALGEPPAGVTFTDVCATGSKAKMGNPASSTSEEIELPFAFPLYGGQYTKLKISTEGWISFSRFIMSSETRRAAGKQALPSFAGPNAAVYALWEDLALRDDNSVCWAVVGAAPGRAVVVQWNHAYFENNTTPDGDVTFQARLGEDGTVDLLYDKVVAGNGREDRPANATIGVENEEKKGAETGGTQGLASPATPASGLRIRFTPTR